MIDRMKGCPWCGTVKDKPDGVWCCEAAAKAFDEWYFSLPGAPVRPSDEKEIQMFDKIDGPYQLPDGSGFAVASMPLPEDHWLTAEGFNNPPMPFRTGTAHPRHSEIVEAVREAGRYALRCATMNGKEDDLDPDALIQNLVVGMLGYWTPDGTSSDHDFDPKPLPPLFPW